MAAKMKCLVILEFESKKDREIAIRLLRDADLVLEKESPHGRA